MQFTNSSIFHEADTGFCCRHILHAMVTALFFLAAARFLQAQDTGRISGNVTDPVGAVIVGVGLPQLCVERDLIRAHFQQQNGSGFDYAYTFPGMNRVLQAIGRVIRSETDHGVVLLIDARFNEVRYRRLFPAWWKYLRVRHADGLREAVGNFWKRVCG